MSTMLLVLVTLSYLVAVQAQTLPCCMMDKQWSATMIDAQIMVKGNNVTSDFFYDGVNSSISIQYYELGNTQRVRLNKTVTLYSKKIRYNISPDGNCTKKNITDLMLPYCIPGTALYRGSSYLGDEGSMLKIDGWHFSLGSLNITMSVSDYDCVPIIAGVAGMSDSSPFSTLLYFNGHKDGITDPTAFDVPSNC